MINEIILVTGGFDPIHSGHINLLQNAARLIKASDHDGQLFVGLNSDAWLTRKKGAAFMPWHERAAVLRAIKGVDRVFSFNDDDGTAIDAIRKIRAENPKTMIFFANGGDRTKENIPEMVFKDDPAIKFLFGIGGDTKDNSSSWILKEWKSPKTERPWGYYRVLHHEDPHVKVKELTVNPGKALSLQRHERRSELWFVAEGIATLQNESLDKGKEILIPTFCSVRIYQNEWHRLVNKEDVPLKIIEIQYGEECVETDIERK